MIRARIHEGKIEMHDPIPEEWEGQLVKLTPLTPDDAQADLEADLATMKALGPVEFDPDERQLWARLQVEQDCLSKEAMQQIADLPP